MINSLKFRHGYLIAFECSMDTENTLAKLNRYVL